MFQEIIVGKNYPPKHQVAGKYQGTGEVFKVGKKDQSFDENKNAKKKLPKSAPSRKMN